MAGDTKQPNLITLLRLKIGERDNASADRWPSRRLDRDGKKAHPELAEGGDTLQFSWQRPVYNDNRALIGLNLDGEFLFLRQEGRQVGESNCHLHLFTGFDDIS